MIINAPLSENERSLLLSKSENIRKITEGIPGLLTNCIKNQSEILHRMAQIFFNLRDISALSENLILKPELITFRNEFLSINTMFEQEERQKIIQNRVEQFCKDANSVTLNKKRESR